MIGDEHEIARERAKTTDSLDELMKIHPPGTRFSLRGYRRQESFECHFYASGVWHGIYRDEQLRIYQEASGTCNGWSLWQEPKNKVKKVVRRWLRGNKNGNVCFTTDEEFAASYDKSEWVLINNIHEDIQIEVDDDQAR